MEKLIQFKSEVETLCYEQLEQRLYRLMLKMSHNWVDAIGAIRSFDIDDIMQELKVILYKSFLAYSIDKGVIFYTYVCKNFNKHLWYLARGKKPDVYNVDDEVEYLRIKSTLQTTDFTEKLIDGIAYKEILKHFDVLTENQKKMMNLIYIENKRQSDIAKTLNVHQRVVYSAEQCAIRKLKKIVGV